MQYFLPRFVVLLSCISASIALGQPITFKLSGHIFSSETRETVPGASLAIIGTTKGARSNRSGAYSLMLEANKEYRIRVSSLGFKPDTLKISISEDKLQDVLLMVEPLRASDVIVTADASRREARRIIKQVIDQKASWHSEIKNYTCEAYSKINLQKISGLDTMLMTVFETFANGYYDRVKGYREQIVGRKQTANIPPAINRVSLLGVSNFYDDRIKLPDYSVVSPLATDAFDRYDYDLLGTRQIGGVTAYEISVECRGVVAPAFEGKVWIDVADYSLVFLQLHPNSALKFQFVTQADLEQTYVEVKNKYILPSQTHVAISAQLQLPFTPSFAAELTGVLQNYEINTTIPDSIFSGERREVDSSADKISSAKWQAMRATPLTAQEESAYARIDTAVKYALPAEKDSSIVHFSFSPILSYDRVQATRIGLSVGAYLFQTAPLFVGFASGYSFGDKKFRYTASLDIPILWKFEDKLVTTTTVSTSGEMYFDQQRKRFDILSGSFSYFDDLERIGATYGSIANSATAIIFKKDYPDYYAVKGFDASLQYNITNDLEVNLQYVNRDERSVLKTTDKAILFPSDTFRANPLIAEGKYEAYTIALGYTLKSGYASFAPKISVTTTGSNSSYEYTSLSVTAECKSKLEGLGPTTLQLAYNHRLSGLMPDHHLFIFDETRNYVFAVENVFHTMNLREYQGDEMFSALFEQNFYDLPTRLLGLNLHPLDLHWFGFLNIASSTLSAVNKAYVLHPVTSTGDVPFIEAGFGIGNIFNILRIDAAWRVSHRKPRDNFAATLSLGLHF